MRDEPASTVSRLVSGGAPVPARNLYSDLATSATTVKALQAPSNFLGFFFFFLARLAAYNVLSGSFWFRRRI